ncbi:MAG: TetR/AcrR family transcriptional regulator [Ktedonobacteraceae bacterium]|nr:TetR/AcrR family transcriptional regulator [Ktedonobacteraceae bacterium]
MARTPKVVEDRREQIIDAALHVFAQKGFTRATNKDIAREAGITPGLIYHYFDSKEALFMEMLERRSPISIVKAMPAEMFDLPAEDFLRTLVLHVLQLVEGEDFLLFIRTIAPEIIVNPTLSTLFRGLLQQQVLAFLHDFFARKMANGELRAGNPEIAGQMLIGSVMSFVMRRHLLQDETLLALSQQEITDSIVDMFLLGLKPREQ